uniref:Uncharacterized protein n=1 Tax=Arundo donax TaxID=35708 RepID=A0A0A9HSJ0_ARUDO
MDVLQIQMSWFSVKEENQTAQGLKLTKSMYLHTQETQRWIKEVSRKALVDPIACSLFTDSAFHTDVMVH